MSIDRVSKYKFNIGDSVLYGTDTITTQKTIGDLKDVFQNEGERSTMNQESIVYSVSLLQPVKAGTIGGLFIGTTIIEQGQVDEEYYMTKGHFHQNTSSSEFYWGTQGSGMVLMMKLDRSFHIEHMSPGSIHFIPAETAHRVINTGNEKLIFNACWPADAGYDYDTIYNEGFSCRIFNQNGTPLIIETDKK